MHESTVSRVIIGKYLHTPRGVLEFWQFFSGRGASTPPLNRRFGR